ncbi:MAG: hypothetical protein RR689_03430 [Mucinivorans sp.]
MARDMALELLATSAARPSIVVVTSITPPVGVVDLFFWHPVNPSNASAARVIGSVLITDLFMFVVFLLLYVQPEFIIRGLLKIELSVADFFLKTGAYSAVSDDFKIQSRASKKRFFESHY